MARINSKIDGTDVLGVVSAGETLYMARATHTQFGIVKPSIKDFVFDKDSAELLVRLGIGLKHTDDGIALAIYDGNYVTDVVSTNDGLLIKYTDIDDGTASEKIIPWAELNETQFNALKDYVLNHELTELDFPNGEFTDVQYDTVNGIALTGTAKTKYKDNSDSETTIIFDIPLVAADNTVTIDRATTPEIKKVLIKATKGVKAVTKTANGSLECTLSDNTKLQTAPFVTIAQTEGNSEEQVMSQKAVTDALAKKLGAPYGVDFPHGAGTVTYDTTDGMHIRGTMRIYTSTDKTTFIDVPNTEVEIPIKAGTGISIDKAASGEFVEIKNTTPAGGIGVEIGVGSPSSTTQGTLTQTQLETLQANEDNYVMFQHEKYYLNDKGHTEGFLTYTHTGYENNTYWTKSITITISTLAWVLNKAGLAGKGLEFDSNDKLQAKLGTNLSFGENGEINAASGASSYANTSEQIDTLSSSATSSLWNLLLAARSNLTKVISVDPSNNTALQSLLGLPSDMTNWYGSRLYLKMLTTDDITAIPGTVAVHVYLAYNIGAVYEGILYSLSTGTASWTGWTKISGTAPHYAPLYVGEKTDGDDAFYSVISFDSHNQDLIFRANYTNTDVKLSELARKSEIPAAVTYYRHDIVIDYDNGQAILVSISSKSIAIDSLTDLFNSVTAMTAVSGYYRVGNNANVMANVCELNPVANGGIRIARDGELSWITWSNLAGLVIRDAVTAI